MTKKGKNQNHQWPIWKMTAKTKRIKWLRWPRLPKWSKCQKDKSDQNYKQLEITLRPKIPITTKITLMTQDNLRPLLHLCLIIDLIHDTRHLYTRFKIDGRKGKSRGVSGCKQVKNIVNCTSRHGRVCLFSQNETKIYHLIVMQNVQFELRQV